MQLHSRVSALLDEAVVIRQDLHKIPETCFEEKQTQAYILTDLARFSPDRLEKIAKTGVKAVFFGKNATETVAFRADMDGLKTGELNETAYCSTRDGYMHACGHDGHMTILLLLARLIHEQRAQLNKNVVLLFQPAEEGQGGAMHMIAEGALQNPSVDRIYGSHLWPSIGKGKIGVRWGAQMAQTLEFDVVVHGKSAHGASPQLGVDAVVAAAELVTFLQAVITRNVDPHQDALLTIGRISGGVARNIIADEVTLNGTLRVFNPVVYGELEKHIRDMLSGLELATRASFEFRQLMQYPCVNNPRAMVEDFYRYVSMEDIVLVDPSMAAEDFACYQQEIPGLFFFLGIGGGKNSEPLHNSRFDFDEDALLTGAEVYARLLELV